MASRGLEARTSAKINVRQPLGLLRFKTGRWTLRQKALGKGYLAIIRDEVNVKEIKFAEMEKDVELDTTITPELKEEGDVRELIRKIQDLRKEKGLSVGDRASLTVPADMKDLVMKNEEQIKKVTGLATVEVGETLELKV
jgi:isoleucyl-tRNA synthetase